MNESLFDYIENLSSENLTTEILRYILESKDYSVYQIVIYQYIFESRCLVDTEKGMFQIDSQVNFGKFGIPDLVISNDNRYVVMENKFYAQFTGATQIYRYFQYLRNHVSQTKKWLILLTIKDRGKYYENEIIKQFSISNPDVMDVGSLRSFCLINGISYKMIYWDDILTFFNSNDFVIKNLSHYIGDKYFTSAILSEKELKMINTAAIPEILHKLWGGIDKIKDNLVGQNYRVQRTTQSRLVYGFFIECSWGNIWVGYFVSAWSSQKTPYILQIRDKWIKDEFHNAGTDQKLKKLGFVFDKELEYISPIEITETDIVGCAVHIAKEKLSKLVIVFSQND